MMEELLESSDQSSLKCPNCETLMLEFRLEYKPGTDHGDFNILDSGTRHHRRNMRLLEDLGPLGMVLGAAMVVNEVSKEMKDDEQVGSRASIVLDGCRECGSFWLDGGERETIQMTSDLIGTSGAAIAEQEKLKREEERVFEEAQERRRLTNCLHIDKRNGKNCRKVTFRSTDYCLEHQLK
jgi:Zn-finger nucleic acid-binding protein